MPDALSANSSAVVAPCKPTLLARLAARVIHLLVNAVAATLRYRFADHSGISDGSLQGPVIFATWHNRLALSLIVYRRCVKRGNPARRMAALVSASRDGALLARVLELFGVEPVRGSSSRRGGQSLLELTTWAEKGFDLAITPDGPRGPCYEVQRGVASLAKVTGLPIVPVAYHLAWKIRLRSWDRFQIPLPFSRCEIAFGEPVRVPSDAGDEQCAGLRQELERRLRALTRD